MNNLILLSIPHVLALYWSGENTYRDAIFELAQEHLAEIIRPQYVQLVSDDLRDREISDAEVAEVISIATLGVARCQLKSLELYPDAIRGQIMTILVSSPENFAVDFVEAIESVPNHNSIEATRMSYVADCAINVWASLELFGYEDYFDDR